MSTEGSFEGAAGGKIHWRVWEAESPVAQVVIVHGYGEHGDRYTRLAGRLNAEGVSVWANDHRGHGRSEGHRGVGTDDGEGNEVARRVEKARAEHPGLPIFMFAHSMGGTIGLRYAIDHQDKLDGLVLSSAAVSLEGLEIPGLQRKVITLLSKVAPRLPANRLPFEGISRDPDELQIYMEDPLVYKGAQPAKTVVEILDAMEALPEEVDQLHIPLLVIAGSADPIVPSAGSIDIERRAGSTDKQITVYDEHVHELINEPLEDREKVTKDIVDWLLARTSQR